jgi:hypothetical protein
MALMAPCSCRDRHEIDVIFEEKKSGLVRISDAIKVTLRSAAFTTRELLENFGHHENAIRTAQALARRAQSVGGAELDEVHGQIIQVLKAVPQDVALRGVGLQSELHSQVLTAVLLCCFCLESYVNSLAYFLFNETDFLGLMRGGHGASAELLMDAIERMSTREKWRTISGLKGSDGFNRASAPFQDFVILFNFRDDHVHDKVVDHADNRPRTRYNGRFPDPVSGLLTLSHGLYAARTYWAMVNEIHKLLGTDPNSFHRHYNLAPWTAEGERVELEKLAGLYQRKLGPDGAA